MRRSGVADRLARRVALLARALRPAGRPVSRRDPLGPAGERAAARHLRAAGYRVLGRNVVTPAGEADLVCVAPDRVTIVIVEVKSRRRSPGQPAASAAIAPEASIHAAKRRRLASVARAIAGRQGWQDRPLRIDAVAVEWPDSGRPVIRHHQDAVRGS